MLRMPWSLKALEKFKHSETVPTPSAFSDCDRARISGSSAAAEGTAAAATAAATMAEEDAEEEEVVVVVAGQAEVKSESQWEVGPEEEERSNSRTVTPSAQVGSSSSESKYAMGSSCATLEERLDTLFMDMLVLNLGGLIEKLACGGVDSVS
jgi:hypothetical protein